jgi:hypothetical protein
MSFWSSESGKGTWFVTLMHALVVSHTSFTLVSKRVLTSPLSVFTRSSNVKALVDMFFRRQAPTFPSLTVKTSLKGVDDVLVALAVHMTPNANEMLPCGCMGSFMRGWVPQTMDSFSYAQVDVWVSH